MKDTPWGIADSEYVIAEGITSYTTPSHGGIRIDTTRLNAFPKSLTPFILGCVDVSEQIAWFEEDCNWSYVALAFPEYFQDSQEVAEATIRNYYPEAWEAFYGKKLEPGQSNQRDFDIFLKEHANDFLVLTAWGSWAEHVPEGMVGVYAVRGGRKQKSAEEGYFLVPKDEYNKRQGDFVVNPIVHQRLNVPLGAHKAQ